MALIIDELIADLEPEAHAEQPAADARPAEGEPADRTLDLLELTAEREERLRVD